MNFNLWKQKFLSYTLVHLIMPKIHASLQIAAQVVLDESIKCVEHELASMDVEEHMERPPRTVIKSSE